MIEHGRRHGAPCRRGTAFVDQTADEEPSGDVSYHREAWLPSPIKYADEGSSPALFEEVVWTERQSRDRRSPDSQL